jgi:AcrR family transcriptional regulator
MASRSREPRNLASGNPSRLPGAPDVRSRILQAAVALLADHGPGELTQPKVARAAGVRQSHLTYYFPTRAELLLAVAAHSIDALASGMAASAQEGSLTRHTLAPALVAAVSDKRRARVMLGLAVTADQDAELKPRFREFVGTIRARIGALLAQIGVVVDADTLAACHTMLVGAAVLNLARDDAASRRELQMVAGVIVERILAAGPGPRSSPQGVPAC